MPAHDASLQRSGRDPSGRVQKKRCYRCGATTHLARDCQPSAATATAAQNTTASAKMKDQIVSKREDSPSKPITFARQVRQEILALISKHQGAVDQQPPFSTQELIVMALLLTRQSQPVLRASEILAWILRAFKYFQNRAIEEYAQARIVGHAAFDSDPGSSVALSDFYPAFDHWIAPIYSISKDIVTVTSEVARTQDIKFCTSIPEGRIFLGKWLDREMDREKPSKFTSEDGGTNTPLKLPPEVRKSIFEMAFAFRWPGLIVRNGTFRLFKRLGDGPSNLNADEDTLEAPPIQSILALLRVNRAMYREAIPCFYSQNMFFFDTIRDFARFAQKLTADRRALLRNILFMYNNTWRRLDGFESGAKLLSKFGNLHRIEISIVDDTWFDGTFSDKPGVKGTRLFELPDDLPGIQNIAFSLHKAAKYKIHGPCDRIREFIEDRVQKFQAADRSREVERLRRAEELTNAKSFKEAERAADAERIRARKRLLSPERTPYSGVDGDLDKFEVHSTSRHSNTSSLGGDDRSGKTTTAMSKRESYSELLSGNSSRVYKTGSEGADRNGSEGRSSKRRKGY